MDGYYKIYAHIAPDGRLYIGQTINSMKNRIGNNGNGYKGCHRFWDAICEFGWENFRTIVIFDDLPESLVDIVEMELIKKFNTTNIKYGFNMASGGRWISKNYKKVYQYNLDGLFLQEYGCAAVAVEKYGFGVYDALAKRALSGAGFLWSYEKHDKIDPYTKPINANVKKCFQYDVDGKYIGEYVSMTSAAKHVGADAALIYGACYGEYKTISGFQWRVEKFDKIDPVKYDRNGPSYRVYQYDNDDHSFIAGYESAKEACRQIGRMHGGSNIIRSCSNINATAYGYKWSFYKSDFWDESLSCTPPQKKYTPVQQYDLNNNLLNEFLSHLEASKHNNIRADLIRRCCMGNRKTAGGFIWKYKKVTEE